MSTYGSILPGARRMAGLVVELSKPARQRLKWFDYYEFHNHNARLTCRYFDISPQTFYHWKHRYDPYHMESLEDRSHHPKHPRQPTASAELIMAVQHLRMYILVGARTNWYYSCREKAFLYPPQW